MKEAQGAPVGTMIRVEHATTPFWEGWTSDKHWYIVAQEEHLLDGIDEGWINEKYAHDPDALYGLQMQSDQRVPGLWIYSPGELDR
jgi:hypothetical protein